MKYKPGELYEHKNYWKLEKYVEAVSSSVVHRRFKMKKLHGDSLN
jgi:hypothetical protein